MPRNIWSEIRTLAGTVTSSPHTPARRVNSRIVAPARQLDLGRERAKLENKKILHSLRHKQDLDEAPGAYKNIETVMQQQRDLVDIIDVLEPLAVIKG